MRGPGISAGTACTGNGWRRLGWEENLRRDFAVQIGHRRKSLLVLDEFQRGIGYKGRDGI